MHAEILLYVVILPRSLRLELALVPLTKVLNQKMWVCAVSPANLLDAL